MDFSSTSAFAAFFEKVVLSLPIAQEIGLRTAAKAIEAEAKAEIGVYQAEVERFEEWRELANFTKQDRVAQGFPENEPLLRTGEMRDSIEHSVDPYNAVIGSNSEIAIWQELGTDKIPPRSFLGGAAARKSDEVVLGLAETLVDHLRGLAANHFSAEE